MLPGVGFSFVLPTDGRFFNSDALRYFI